MWQNKFKILKWWKLKTDSESIYLAVFVLWAWINMKELKLSALSALSLLPYKITDNWATYINTKLECRLPSNNKFLIYKLNYNQWSFKDQNITATKYWTIISDHLKIKILQLQNNVFKRSVRKKRCNFLNLYGHYVLQHESFLTIFSL